MSRVLSGRQAVCPVCRREVYLRMDDKLPIHRDQPRGGRTCAGSLGHGINPSCAPGLGWPDASETWR